MTRDERGQAGLEGVAFGVLLFAMGALVIANAWSVIDTKIAASAAAREAVRAYVEASDADAASVDAETAARAAMAGHGRNGSAVQVVRREGSFSRCARVVMEARYAVRLGALPLLGRGGASFTVAARHSEVVDPYRSGLGGEARCAA